MGLDIINSLISGIIIFKIRNDILMIKPPSAEDKTFADFFSNEVYEESKLDGFWTKEELREYLIENGYWSEEEESSIEQLNKNIENMKVDYLSSFHSQASKDYIKRNLSQVNEKVEKLFIKRGLFLDKTCDYIREYFYQGFLIEKNCYSGNEICRKYGMHTLVDRVNSQINQQFSLLRETAKSARWRNMWGASKERTFANSPSSFTDLQLNLISWSYFYDNVYESPERPSQEIIEDDIALDGWSIKQRRSREEENKKKNAENLPGSKSAGEIFIPAKNKEDVAHITKMNDGYGLAKIKSLAKDLKQHGAVEESNLTSTRQELQMAANSMSPGRKK